MILSVGEILIDLFKTNGTDTTCVGGAPFNVAVRAKRAGAKVGFCGNVGDDDYGKFILDNTRKYALDFAHIIVLENTKTTIAEVSLDNCGERSFRFLRDNTADYQFDINHVDLDKIKPSILHIGTLMLNEEIGRQFALDLTKKAQEKGILISVDVNFRDDLFKSKKDRDFKMKPLIESADILKMGLDEILDYTEQSNLENAVKSLPYKNILFVTDGENGSHLFVGKNHSFIPSQKVHAVDTTGAGDAFHGTALAGIDNLIEKGLPLTIDNLIPVVQKANIEGANAVSHIGAI